MSFHLSMESNSDARKQRGLLLSQSARLKQIVGGTWLVPSQSQSSGGYVVDTGKGTCTCPDYELNGETLKCKHQWAVHFARFQSAGAAKESASVKLIKRPNYPQKWPAYNAAQTSEKSHVLSFLKSLCGGIQNPPQTGKGRPRAPLADVVFAAIVKTFVGMSGRRAQSDIEDCAADGLIDRTIPYNTIFYYMKRPELTPILKAMLMASAVPVAMLETKFAIDGTGFGTQVYHRWYDHKYGREKKEADWFKLHAVCGVTTNIITAAEVTEADVHDSPLLPTLLAQTRANFDVAEFLGDKGYLSRQNLEVVSSSGATPYIAFKINSKAGTTVDAWWRAFHVFAYNRDEWLQHYHQRSNIESTFSAIKRKFGGMLRSRDVTAQMNEVLLKCIAHNLSCLVHVMFEFGVTPEFHKGLPK